MGHKQADKQGGKQDGNWRFALTAIVALLLGSAGISFLSGCNGDTVATTGDPTVLSFAMTADSRIDTGAGTTVQDNLWLNNTPVFLRMVREIQVQKPTMLFFVGDMIMGYDNTLPLGTAKDNVLNPQYAYWRGLVAPLLETGTYVVPVPGNHETSDISQLADTPAGKKIVTVANEKSWRTFMADMVDGIAGLRFGRVTGYAADNVNLVAPPISVATPAVDNIVSDQSKLTYSFDLKGSHFVVINTDPFIAGGATANKFGSAPTAWLATDLAAAHARGVKHNFVFGHRPAYSLPVGGLLYNGLDGKDNTSSDNVIRDAFWSLVEQYKATYFCGHEHVYHPSQPLGAGKAWQVLAGTAGAPFEPGATASDNTYAWINVNVHQSGRVSVDAYGFDNVFGPTRIIRSWDLPAGF